MQVRSLWCVGCGRWRRFERERVSLGMGCALSLVTCGMVFPLFVVVAMAQELRRYRCGACGEAYHGPRNPVEARERRRWARELGAAADDGPDVGGGLVLLEDSAAAEPSCFVPASPWRRRWRSAVRAWDGLAAGYRALPDWAGPIVWGLGAAAPACVWLAMVWAYRHG